MILKTEASYKGACTLLQPTPTLDWCAMVVGVGWMDFLLVNMLNRSWLELWIVGPVCGDFRSDANRNIATAMYP